MLCIGADITVKIMNVQGNQVRLGIAAPADIRVDREEIRRRKDAGFPPPGQET